MAQGLALCVIPCHPCMRTCVLFFERLSSPVFLLPRPVPLPALPDVQLGAKRVLHRRSPVQLQLGEHGHSGLCHTTHRMRMVKMYIQELYMSGESCFLSHTCSELFCDATEDFNGWLQKQLIGSAEINLCSRNSCLTSRTELQEDLAWVCVTVVR